MKKLIYILLIPFISMAHGQYTDYWTGKLNTGMEITIEFNVIYDPPNPKIISLDVPEQYTWDVEAYLIKWSKDSFCVGIPSINAEFKGQKQKGDSLATGLWIQNGYQLPLTLYRSLQGIEPIRPQTPNLYPEYIIEQLVIINSKDNVQLSGTLTIPKGYNMKGCAILVSGSGKQDRDEKMMGHQPFWVIADYLTNNGYAVMRFDDRGCYNSSGSFENSTIFDFANDVNAAIDLAKERTGISDDAKMGLIGHSEGSMVSQIVLKDRPLGFFISLAGPAVPVKELMIQQNYDLCELYGIKKEEFKKSVEPFLGKAYAIIGDLKMDSTTAGKKLKDLFKKTLNNASEATKNYILMGGSAENLDPVIGYWLDKKFRTFISFNPALYLSVIKTPMLALNGSVDQQVSCIPNLTIFKTYLKNNSMNEVLEMPNKNHLFQNSTTGDIFEYGKIEETISPDVLAAMLKWLQKIYH